MGYKVGDASVSGCAWAGCVGVGLASFVTVVDAEVGSGVDDDAA